jgi:dTMP kinase
MPTKTKNAGRLISFEGPEGSGKSTQITRLAARFQQAGREVVTTREPGGTEIGEQIRNIVIHNSKGDEMCPETELLLYTAARAQVVRQIIAPALARGAIVLTDRYLDSTTVYQGMARNLAPGPVSEINRFAVGDIMPHLTIVVDVPVEIGRSRIQKRATALPDRMERQNLSFFAKVREGYLKLAAQAPDRIVVLDGTLSVDALEQKIWTVVEERLG